MTNPAQTSAHELLAAEKFRRARGFWRVLALIAATVAVLALVGRFVLPGAEASPHLARLTIDGLITTDPARTESIDALIEDEAVVAVIVDINSTGGTTAGGEELYEDLRRLSAAKPTVAVIREYGASAAYMTAIGADHILARRLSIVGSIGVFYQHVNAGGLLDTLGIDLEKVASGPVKGRPDFDEPITPEVRVPLAALVEDSFAWFVDIVAERRGLERPAALALADGRVMTGRVGVETGLIDDLGGETEAITWLETEREIAENLPVLQAWPLPAGQFDILGSFIGSSARSALGLPAQGPVALDGLVSLWQVDQNP